MVSRARLAVQSIARHALRTAVLAAIAVRISGPSPARAEPGPGEDPARAEYRFTFAESYFGLSLSLAPSPGKVNLTPDAETPDEIELPTMLAPRLVVGGLHFWAHADLYVAFSPLWLRTSEPRGITTRFTLGIEAGMKLYPWALSPGTIRPFAGIAWSVNAYSQDDGPLLTIHQVPVMIGAAWRTSRGIFELGASLHMFGDRDYPLGREPGNDARFIPEVLDVWLGYRYEFDSTKKFIEESRSGRLAERYEAFAREDKLDAWEFALGPSAAFPISESEFDGDGAFLSGLKRPTIVPDAAIGYYWQDFDAVVRANYRFFYASDEGYGRQHTYVRHSLSLDALKFLFDYNGFVPFLGGGVSVERLDYDAHDDETGERANGGAFKAALSVVLGWDVRPFETKAWILRTNLRFTPGLDLRRGDARVAFDHVEFNFIQLVFYPERFF